MEKSTKKEILETSVAVVIIVFCLIEMFGDILNAIKSLMPRNKKHKNYHINNADVEKFARYNDSISEN